MTGWMPLGRSGRARVWNVEQFKRCVVGSMLSPIRCGEHVLTLSCGHLHAWPANKPYPAVMECEGCDQDDLIFVERGEIARRLAAEQLEQTRPITEIVQ
jgi:hypothetical protein